MYRNDRAAQQGHGKRRETVVHIRSQDVGVALLAESHHLLGGVRHPQSRAVTERSGPEERVDGRVDVFQDRPFHNPVPHRGDVEETFPVLLGDHHSGQVQGPVRPRPEFLGELLQSFLNPLGEPLHRIGDVTVLGVLLHHPLPGATKRRQGETLHHLLLIEKKVVSSHHFPSTSCTKSPTRPAQEEVEYDENNPSKFSTIPHGNSSPN